LDELEHTEQKVEYKHGASQCGHKFMVGSKLALQMARIFHQDFICYGYYQAQRRQAQD